MSRPSLLQSSYATLSGLPSSYATLSGLPPAGGPNRGLQLPSPASPPVTIDPNIGLLRQISECFGAKELFANKQISSENFENIIFDTLFAIFIDKTELRASNKYKGPIKNHLLRSFITFKDKIDGIQRELLSSLHNLVADHYLVKIAPKEATPIENLISLFYGIKCKNTTQLSDLDLKNRIFNDNFFVALTCFMKESGIMNDDRFGKLPVEKRKREDEVEDLLPNKSARVDTPPESS